MASLPTIDASSWLLSTTRGGVSGSATIEDSKVSPLTRIEDDAVITNSEIGDNVTIEAGARVYGSRLSNTIVGAGAEISGSQHRFTVRFLEWSTIDSRAVQTGHDVPFQLSICQ